MRVHVRAGKESSDTKGKLMRSQRQILPVSFHIQPTEAGKFQVLKNGTAIRDYSTRDDAQTYIDTWRQVAARLSPDPVDTLPIEAMTDEEWQILDPKQDWESP